jgi:hypothetical protein
MLFLLRYSVDNQIQEQVFNLNVQHGSHGGRILSAAKEALSAIKTPELNPVLLRVKAYTGEMKDFQSPEKILKAASKLTSKMSTATLRRNSKLH